MPDFGIHVVLSVKVAVKVLLQEDSLNTKVCLIVTIALVKILSQEVMDLE